MAFDNTDQTPMTPAQAREVQLIEQQRHANDPSVQTQMFEAFGVAFVIYVLPVLVVLYFINKALNIWASKR